MKGLFIGALLLTPAIVHADNYMHDMAVCAIKGSEKARLNCYDSLANKLGVSPPSPVKPSNIKNKGKWQVNTEKSQIDDRLKILRSVYVLPRHQGRSILC